MILLVIRIAVARGSILTESMVEKVSHFAIKSMKGGIPARLIVFKNKRTLLCILVFSVGCIVLFFEISSIKKSNLVQ